MPRRNIRRDQTGGAVVPALPGGASTVWVAQVSFPDGLERYIDDHEDIIWRTAVGHTDLHKSTKVRNMPPGAIGYIHSINNVCLAVSRLDVDAGTMELCGGVGHVNNNVHIF
jgi:hypothetical protein